MAETLAHAPPEPPLRLPTSLRRQLHGWARDGYPHEVCGLLVGSSGAEATTVSRVTRARNLAVERLRDRYTLDPEHFLAVDSVARESGMEVVGVWHTHPDHPPRPSSTDREAAWECFSYLILAVNADGVADITAWRLRRGRFDEQPVEELKEIAS